MTVADIQGMFREAWSAALAGASAAEQEAEKALGRLADAAGFSPEDVRRSARELTGRLSAQRREIEASIEDGVRRAATRFGIPTPDEMSALARRLDAVSERLTRLERAGQERKGDE
jgi:polyhydroxyalkanoate synthesis regulator phasin